ncbi:HEAT repeat protein [Hamadaea flava]|uniref:HEAT repeat domain-containing protein n=1 Tax=Hamadaea flava TaxID=1742688 RepID=A0ABV8M2K0_9ACTN|nr:hypothetical protein [Hamadaea flava]MCP2324459.1 HEAT repeat protein [Hamadaea flava]
MTDGVAVAGEVRRAADALPTDLARQLIALSRDGAPRDRAIVLAAMRTASARFWSLLDEEVRREWQGAPVWTHALAVRLTEGEDDLLRLAMAASHPSGYLREAATALLATTPDPVAVTVLALRSGDWVPVVRAAARKALARRLPAMPLVELSSLVDIAFHLDRRASHEWLAEAARDRLRSLTTSEVQAVLPVRAHRARRTAYQMLIESGQLTTPQLIAAATADPDQTVRAMCARAAIAGTTGLAELRSLAHGRTGLVRAEAVHVLAKRGEYAEAEALLADRSQIVRTVARNVLRIAGMEVLARYRALVDADDPTTGAIAGLGEVGDQRDAARLRRWLRHPQARVRAATVVALRRIGNVDQAMLLPMLRDNSSAVVAQARTSLLRIAGELDCDHLERLVHPETPTHTRFAAYRLLAAANVWQRVILDLRLYADSDERLRRTARTDLASWLAHGAATTYSMPTPAQAQLLSGLIANVRPIVGDRTALLLRFHTGT